METKRTALEVGTRVLAANGQAVIITKDGKCKKVVTAPKVNEDELLELTKKASTTNNKVLFEKVKAVCEEAKMRKGWITAKGFRFRFAPAGFEMFDVENRMTPIDLGETPTVEEIAGFIEKPRLAKIIENRKKVEPKKEVVEEKPVAVAKTDEDMRKDGLKIIRGASRKDFRYLTEIKGLLHDAVVNRKYRVQLGKMFKEVLSKTAATQKRNYDKTIAMVKEHLTTFDFSPARKVAPKFMGLEELVTVSLAVFPNEVSYKSTEKGKMVTMPKTKYLAHDVLYNWPEYNVVIGKVSTGELSLQDALSNKTLDISDKYFEFKKEMVAVNNEDLNILLDAIYDEVGESSPLTFVYGTNYKTGTNVKVKWPDYKTSYKGKVTQNNPLRVRYEDGEVFEVLEHQKVTVL